ncbi:hypothetical protein BYT27DRAFT_6614786 [Phlegmacium glaucopus]|nr:hypothetical protein BYT27DRAFT_6614786 [Phlegmacium glaucopus]
MLRSFIRSVPKPTARLQRRSISSSVLGHHTPYRPREISIRLSVARLHPTLYASFHSTRRNQGIPLIPLLAALLKTSTGFEVARTASRIALTFIPLVWIKNLKSYKAIKFGTIRGIPTTEEDKARYLKRIRRGTLLLRILLLVPFVLFWSTIIASLERTPLTGRWRMILLSPEEEDEIASQLAGPGWLKCVGEILAKEGSAKIIPSNDWRYEWVRDTLRKLETGIPVLAREWELCPNWAEGGSDHKPLPPPARYPLRPRPRASEYLHYFCCKLTENPQASTIFNSTPPGPPYSLLVVDKPELSNAFSYGFGSDGGSGIVIYSGFLDDVLAKNSPQHEAPPPPKQSFLSKFVTGIFSGPPSPPPHPIPTEEQTSELAILLAHEMAHLILCHHLESLSSVTVIVPGTLSIASDVLRVIIFPITMLFGPFVNDAVAQLGKVGSLELAKVSEHCTSTKQEIEADVVSARLLAHAGFDARDAVKFWESRSDAEVECARHGTDDSMQDARQLARRIMGETHPVSELRVNSLKKELERWEAVRQEFLTRAASQRTEQ